jgi:glycosyltransferase involved in cell wall biosynthesis
MVGLPPKLSVVVPCYNEAAVISETAKQLGAVLDGHIANRRLHQESRVYFIDDGSTDHTWALIDELARSSSLFEGIKLSRNRGHQNALMAGLLLVPGDLVLSVDADLQDDLNAIEAMLKAHSDGADIVFGVRRDRQSDTFFKRATAQGYYRLLKLMRIEIIYNHADYRLMSRRAIDALRQYEESNLFLRAIIPQLGFPTASVNYQRRERFAGTSKYPLRKMLSFAFQGISSFSTQPLRAITFLGFVVSAVSFLLTLWAFLVAIGFGRTVPGWASTVVPIYMICGVQMLCLGIIGEYIGKIYIETKRRPRYIIEESTVRNGSRCNGDSETNQADCQ